MDNANNLWIGTAYGIDYFNARKNKFTHYTNPSGEKYGGVTEQVYAMAEEGSLQDAKTLAALHLAQHYLHRLPHDGP